MTKFLRNILYITYYILHIKKVIDFIAFHPKALNDFVIGRSPDSFHVLSPSHFHFKLLFKMIKTVARVLTNAKKNLQLRGQLRYFTVFPFKIIP